MIPRAVIAFTGFNQRASLSFIRVLKKSKTPFAIIAKDRNDSILLSDYKSNVAAVRDEARLDMEDMIKRIKIVKKKLKAKEYFIAPSSEALNRFLLEYRKDFLKEGCIVPLVEEEVYSLISDKSLFGKLCEDNNVITPKKLKNPAEFPFAAKPKFYFSASGRTLAPYIIQNEKDYADFLTKENESEFYYQEFIGGKSFYLLYYFKKDGSYISFSQQNFVQQHEGKSIIAAKGARFHQKPICEDFVKIFRSVNYFGLAMVEIKNYKGRNYMIEANPRLWGPSQLFIDAGIKFFENYLNDFGFNIKDDVSSRNLKNENFYFWFGGMMQTLCARKKLAFHAYSLKKLIYQMDKWLASDVYKRKDTIKIFLSEIN